jgi:NAD(P)-dependent dehydrogenase (short-subunit alcohol dehydrogenase family)
VRRRAPHPTPFPTYVSGEGSVLTAVETERDGRDLFSLAGAVAVVTGAARGVGLAAATALAAYGAAVVMFDVLEDDLADGADRVRRDGGTAIPVVGSVSETDDVERLAQVAATVGQVSIVVNCAGVMRRRHIQEMTLDDLDELWKVNVAGTVAVTQRFLGQMISAGYGKVVNVGSLGSVIGLERRTGYATTKGAVAQYTTSLASEVGQFGVRANVVAPGYVDTDMASPYIWGDPARTERLLGRIPLGRFADPQDLQGAFVFLASRASDYVTGQLLIVDGGWTST